MNTIDKLWLSLKVSHTAEADIKRIDQGQAVCIEEIIHNKTYVAMHRQILEPLLSLLRMLCLVERQLYDFIVI